MEGWIKLHRKITDNPYYFSEPFTRSQAWVDMLIIANHKESMFYKRGIRVDVSRGQIGYDIETLAKRWRWSRGKVERFFSQLEKDEQIVRQKTNITTLISVCNYDIYQSDDNPNDNANSKANDKANGQQTVKQTDTNKNDKNDNNVKNEKELISFDRFWNLYDKKVGSKEKVFEKWVKLSEADKEKIFETLPQFKAKIKDKQFQPHPQTYLNNKRWLDEIETEKQINGFRNLKILLENENR